MLMSLMAHTVRRGLLVTVVRRGRCLFAWGSQSCAGWRVLVEWSLVAAVAVGC